MNTDLFAISILVFQSIVFFGQLCCLLVALKIYKKQANEAFRMRKLEATKIVFDQIGNPEVREVRGWLLDQDERFTPDLTNRETERKMRTLIVAYDRIAYLVDHDLFLGSDLIDFQADEIKLIWQKVSPLVKVMQQHRRNYARWFQKLASPPPPQSHSVAEPRSS